MLCNISKCFSNKINKSTCCIRHMTTAEVSNALRPFYFSVHPDLFGQYPNQRVTNENSLKQLSSVIETLQSRRPVRPCSLKFYVRDKTHEGNFQLINVFLNEKDVRGTILRILKSCNLPTEYVDKIPVQPMQKETVRIKINPNWDLSNLNENDPIFAPYIMKKKIKEAREAHTLKNWLQKHHNLAHEYTALQKPVKEEITRLKSTLSEQLGILEVRWECGWNEQHFRGCLQSLKALAEQYPDPMHIMRGRILVFAPFTGVSLDGHIMLNSGEVRHNWLDLINNVQKHDAVLLRIPSFEKAVSQVLRDMRVVRRKFMPKIMAEEYERHLLQFTTSLNDYLGKRSYPKHWPDSLKQYEIVVDSEAGPLMVSPTGQFIVPSSCPSFLIVSFINDNLEEAEKRMAEYKENKYVERSLHKKCVEELELDYLNKEDNVTPNLMIQCCQKLLEHKEDLKALKGIHLYIAHYYSVLSDGVLCIPWNWVL